MSQQSGTTLANILVSIGPPGAGKGTQSTRMAEFLRVPHISTGDILRDNIRRNTLLGRSVDATLKRGGLVPDQLVLKMLIERIAYADCTRGFVLDGFPRTRVQAEALDVYLCDPILKKATQWTDPLVIHFTMDEASVLTRLTGRRICPNCGRAYNVIALKPRTKGKCDFDDTRLVVRPDDKEEIVHQRFREYEREIPSVVDYYSRRHRLIEIRADQSMAEVTVQLVRLIGSVSDQSTAFSLTCPTLSLTHTEDLGPSSKSNDRGQCEPA